MDTNHDRKAKKMYLLLITGGEGGTIPAGIGQLLNGKYEEGDFISLIARAHPGYKFNKWVSTDGGEFLDEFCSSTKFIMPNCDTNLIAQFVQLNKW